MSTTARPLTAEEQATLAAAEAVAALYSDALERIRADEERPSPYARLTPVQEHHHEQPTPPYRRRRPRMHV